MPQGGSAGADNAEGRIVAIDVLRGLAIIWVVLFHLWGDLEFFPGAPQQYYEQPTWQVRHSEGTWRILTSCTDLRFRDGFQGVPSRNSRSVHEVKMRHVPSLWRTCQ